MKNNLFKYLCVLAVAFTFLSKAALAETAKVETTTTTVTKKVEQKIPERQFPICIITGRVLNLQSLEKSAWANGVPSSFSSVEAQIAVEIKKRSPRDPNVRADAVCVTSAQTENRIYKLCSPTPVRVGDLIQGTEGSDTGADGILGCLFDIAVSKETPVANSPEKEKTKEQQ